MYSLEEIFNLMEIKQLIQSNPNSLKILKKTRKRKKKKLKIQNHNQAYLPLTLIKITTFSLLAYLKLEIVKTNKLYHCKKRNRVISYSVKIMIKIKIMINRDSNCLMIHKILQKKSHPMVYLVLCLSKEDYFPILQITKVVVIYLVVVVDFFQILQIKKQVMVYLILNPMIMENSFLVIIQSIHNKIAVVCLKMHQRMGFLPIFKMITPRINQKMEVEDCLETSLVMIINLISFYKTRDKKKKIKPKIFQKPIRQSLLVITNMKRFMRKFLIPKLKS